MIDQVVVGASVSMTYSEVDKLAGNGGIRLVTCPDGRVIGGMGNVGFVEHIKDTDLEKFADEIKTKREQLSTLATDPGSKKLYTFTRI